MNEKIESYIQTLIEEVGLTKEEILKMVQEKKTELKGLISDEGAFFLVGKDFGIDIEFKNGGKIMVEEKKGDQPWYVEAKNAPVAGGVFLPVAYGFEYLLQFENIEDPRNDQAVNKQDMQGNDTVKYWYYVILNGIRAKTSTLEAFIEEELLKQEKVDKIKALEKKKEYLLELPKTARKDFGAFIIKSKLKNGDVFTMKRTGKGGQTKYLFEKLVKETEE